MTDIDPPGEANSGANRHDEPLFPSEVMFYGQPVAWVLADTLEAAQRGASRVRAEYEQVPASLSIADAIALASEMRAGSPAGPCADCRLRRDSYGDAVACFGTARCIRFHYVVAGR